MRTRSIFVLAILWFLFPAPAADRCQVDVEDNNLLVQKNLGDVVEHMARFSAKAAGNHVYSASAWQEYQVSPEDKKDAGWFKTTNIWADSQCPHSGDGSTTSLEACREACVNNTRCTAINWKVSEPRRCYLRACGLPVPPANWESSGFEGHYLSKASDAGLGFKAYSGYIPSGAQIEQAFMTPEQAETRCLHLPGCKGFTFAGRPTTDAVWIDFKSKWDLAGSGWTAYKKKPTEVALNGSMADTELFVEGTRDSKQLLSRVAVWSRGNTETSRDAKIVRGLLCGVLLGAFALCIVRAVRG